MLSSVASSFLSSNFTLPFFPFYFSLVLPFSITLKTLNEMQDNKKTSYLIFLFISVLGGLFAARVFYCPNGWEAGSPGLYIYFYSVLPPDHSPTLRMKRKGKSASPFESLSRKRARETFAVSRDWWAGWLAGSWLARERLFVSKR